MKDDETSVHSGGVRYWPISSDQIRADAAGEPVM
jgi:hypothetical protein